MTWKLCRDAGLTPSIDATYGLIGKTSNEILGTSDKPETYIISCHGDKGIAPTEIAFFVDMQRNGNAIANRLCIFNNYLRFSFKRLGLGSTYLPFMSCDFSFPLLEGLNWAFNGCDNKKYNSVLHSVCLGERDIKSLIINKFHRFVICKTHIYSNANDTIEKFKLTSCVTNGLKRLTVALLKYIIETVDYSDVVKQVKLYLWFVNKREFAFDESLFDSRENNTTKLVTNEFEYDVDYTISQAFKNGDSSDLGNVFDTPYAFEFENDQNIESEEKEQQQILQHNYMKRIYYCPCGRSMKEAIIIDFIDDGKIFITFPILKIDLKLSYHHTNRRFMVPNRYWSPATGTYMAETHIRVLPMITGASMGGNSNQTNNIAEIVNNILKNHTKLLEDIDSMDIMMKRFAEILLLDIQRFWLNHGKEYGKNLKKILKETQRECTNDKPIPNLVRELDLQWKLMIRRMSELFPNFTDETLIKAYQASNCGIGNVKLCKSNIGKLNKPLATMAEVIPSHAGMFVPSVLAFCRHQIKFLEDEEERRNRLKNAQS